MNIDEQAHWKNEALDQVFAALAARSTFTAYVIYKGARILNRLLRDESRQSLDIDMNMTSAFVDAFPTPDLQKEAFAKEIEAALRDYFSRAAIVRFEILGITVTMQKGHPHGWNAFQVRMQLRDFMRTNVRGLPTLELDIAASEKLGPRSIAALDVDGHAVRAYTETRIAGEKMRAFLSTLPRYRTKLMSHDRIVRAKDLFDLVRIERVHPLNNAAWDEFWRDAAADFVLACESRFVDCDGLDTFSEGLATTRAVYESDATIPKQEVSFDLAWESLERIVGRFATLGIFPLRFPLP
jgi:hypothetical protein